MDRIWHPIKKLFIRENANSDGVETIDREITAIDQSGTLGSFYDICQDQISGKLNIDLKSESYMSKKPVKCILYRGRTHQSQNLLEMVGINQSMRISILLQMIQPTGIASIINYPRSINKYTRFLYFYHESLTESCFNNLIKKMKRGKLSSLEIPRTPIISDILWGIHAIIILQLPPDQQPEIDHILDHIHHNLINSEYHIEMSPTEIEVIQQIISTRVYSNIPSLNSITNLYNAWLKILEIKDKIDEHRQLKYIISFIPSLYPIQNGNNINVQVDGSEIDYFENTLLRQCSELRVLQLRLDYELPELLQNKLEEQLMIARKGFSEIKNLYENTMYPMRNLIVSLRKGQHISNSINEILTSDVQTTINDSFRRLTIPLDKLTSKGNLIKQLQNDGIEYCNVVKVGIDQNCNEQLVKDILFKNNLNKAIFCSHDLLKEQSSEHWQNLYTQMIEKRKENPSLTLVYADFTYTTFYLGNMTILLSKDQTINTSGFHTKVILSKTKTKPPSPPPPPVLASSSEYINILLLGESGVGKSTFINAFANYLQFQTLQQAQSGQPIVLIPVSFLITINDNFDEQLVKFGDIDSNEDHNNSGQSVTQQCRSYVFKISNEQKLRIIDTPGFGDTRGDNQDVLNMEMIFSFVNNLTYLNSICLLLKPNSTRLNPLLFSCFTQLFNFFGENIRNNLLFCFTNARSTFFTPGDTRPLLKAFFDSFPIKNIPFEKKNTFCFDSESFRYLVALQEAIKFNEHDRDEFDKSWTRSVEESKRLRNFLCKEVYLYRKNIEWKSIEEAQFQINSLVRPILEAIRNILRNILLLNSNSVINIQVTHVDQPTVICYSCQRMMKMYGCCCILLDHLHSLTNRCTSKQQNLVEYKLDYEFHHNQTNEPKSTLDRQLDMLCETCTKFTRFLMINQSRQDDPFLSDLIRIIEEEKTILQRKNQNEFNQQLVNELVKFKTQYERLFNTTYCDNRNEALSNIYKLIRSINDIPIMKKQMDAIKKYQQLSLTLNEKTLIN